AAAARSFFAGQRRWISIRRTRERTLRSGTLRCLKTELEQGGDGIPALARTRSGKCQGASLACLVLFRHAADGAGRGGDETRTAKRCAATHGSRKCCGRSFPRD